MHYSKRVTTVSSIFKTVARIQHPFFNPVEYLVWSLFSLFTETATSFLIPDFDNNISVCRSSHFIKFFEKAALKNPVYPESSPLEILYPSHKFFRCVTKSNLSLDNFVPSTSQKRVEYVLKTS